MYHRQTWAWGHFFSLGSSALKLSYYGPSFLRRVLSCARGEAFPPDSSIEKPVGDAINAAALISSETKVDVAFAAWMTGFPEIDVGL